MSDTSSDDENVDIVSLITGQKHAAQKAPKTSLSLINHRSSLNNTAITAAASCAKVDHNENDNDNEDNSNNNHNKNNDNENTDDEEFMVKLPPIFATDGMKNDLLAKRDVQIKTEIENEQQRLQREYSQLLQQQLDMVELLNDNGSHGRIKFSLDVDRDLINNMIKKQNRGQVFKKHFYFYSDPQLDDFENEYDDLSLLVLLTKQNYQHLVKERGIVNARLLKYTVNSTNVALIQNVLHLLKYCNDTQFQTNGESFNLSKLICNIGGKSIDNAIDTNQNLRLVYFNIHGFLTTLKASIILRFICINPYQHDLFVKSLRWVILTVADFYLLKNHFEDLNEFFIPGVKCLLEWAANGTNSMDSTLETIEMVLQEITPEIQASFLSIAYTYLSNDQPSNDQIWSTKSTILVRKVIETVVFGPNHNLKSYQNLLNLNIINRYRLSLLPFIVKQDSSQVLSILKKVRDKAHKKLGQLSTGSENLKDRLQKIEDMSHIYDILEFLVSKLDRSFLNPHDLFYEQP